MKRHEYESSVTNFGRNVSFTPEHVFQPATAEELLAILDSYPNQTFRAIGSLHCWSHAIETDSVLVGTDKLDAIEIATDRCSVTVGGGCTIKSLLTQLGQYSLTLPSIGLIAEQTIAGATATGTHGSGKHSLSHYIESVTIAHFDTSNRAVLTTIDSGDDLRAARCSLGLLGIIVSMKIQCRDVYRVQEHAQQHATLQSVLDLEDDYPLQQFYLMPWSWKYFGHHRVESKQPNSKTAIIYRGYCFSVIDIGLHLAINLMVKILRIPSLVSLFFRYVLPFTIVRNWKVVDESNKMLVMKHELFRHIEIEVFVRRTDLEPAIELIIDVLKLFAGINFDLPERTSQKLANSGALNSLQQKQGRYQHHYPICIRRVIPDQTLISMASSSGENEEDWFAISFISYQWPSQRAGFFEFANFIGLELAEQFGGRCHWGKYNAVSNATIKKLYPNLPTFIQTVNRFDPTGRFRNPWLAKTLGLEQND